MSLGPGVCGLCFDRLDGGTFDLDDDGQNVALVLTNVCIPCRMYETRGLIWHRSGWD